MQIYLRRSFCTESGFNLIQSQLFLSFVTEIFERSMITDEGIAITSPSDANMLFHDLMVKLLSLKNSMAAANSSFTKISYISVHPSDVLHTPGINRANFYIMWCGKNVILLFSYFWPECESFSICLSGATVRGRRAPSTLNTDSSNTNEHSFG